MKIFLFFIVVLFSDKNLSAQYVLISPKENYSIHRILVSDLDTIFLIRKNTTEYYHAVYIEKNKNSVFYKNLLNFNFTNEESSNLLSGKPLNGKLKKPFLYHLPKEWLPLYLYRHHYYLYAPSDWGNANRKILSDSGLISWYMEGPNMDNINQVRRINNSTFSLTVQNTFNQSNYIIIIHIIDDQKKIAVWEYVEKNKLSTYGLFVSKDMAKNFNLVVNYCNSGKQKEFEFENIDFKKLIKNKGSSFSSGSSLKKLRVPRRVSVRQVTCRAAPAASQNVASFKYCYPANK